MMTKEEIQRSITELQYQYQSLIREGSYKLAKIRKERIKKLREQLKQLSKAKVQDSMDILRLCGYTNDASIQVGPWTIYQEGNEISVHRGGRAWAQGFKSVQEAKAWIQKKERWLETGKDEDPSVKSLTYKGYTIRYRPSSGKYYISSGPGDTVSLKHIGKEYANLNEAKYSISNNDECPTFTKGITKDKTKVVGQIGSVKIYYDDNDGVYYVNQGGSIFNNPGFKTKQEAINYVVKNNTKDEDKGYNWSKLTPEKIQKKIAEAKAKGANPSYIRGMELALQMAKKEKAKDDDATEHGSIEQYGKGTETESMGLSDDPVLAQDSWTSVYEKAFGNQSMNTLESLKSKSDVIRHFQKLGIDPNSADAKEAMRRWFNSDSKPIKDSDPKVAERSVEDSRSDLDRKQEALEQERYKKSEILARKLNQNQITEREFDSQIRKLNEEYREKERRLLREAKDAEAQAIINLCGGIF